MFKNLFAAGFATLSFTCALAQTVEVDVYVNGEHVGTGTETFNGTNDYSFELKTKEMSFTGLTKQEGEWVVMHHDGKRVSRVKNGGEDLWHSQIRRERCFEGWFEGKAITYHTFYESDSSVASYPLFDNKKEKIERINVRVYQVTINTGKNSAGRPLKCGDYKVAPPTGSSVVIQTRTKVDNKGLTVHSETQDVEKGISTRVMRKKLN
jgi:hypothetical protein